MISLRLCGNKWDNELLYITHTCIYSASHPALSPSLLSLPFQRGAAHISVTSHLLPPYTPNLYPQSPASPSRPPHTAHRLFAKGTFSSTLLISADGAGMLTAMNDLHRMIKISGVHLQQLYPQAFNIVVTQFFAN